MKEHELFRHFHGVVFYQGLVTVVVYDDRVVLIRATDVVVGVVAGVVVVVGVVAGVVVGVVVVVAVVVAVVVVVE